ncbi:unnamed protein product [Polarella glacialis]|uniref:pyridoxal kinase n=1 Tax=Polarella glacialis TaxID=89957 RepID=A0A813HYV4_POLGL|nr:unnamed protein product [Polarella glacialis]CAE8650546.1 unnamed protein product [Polarella glacialis]
MSVLGQAIRASSTSGPRGHSVRFAYSGARRPPAVLSIQSHVVYGAAGNSAAVFPMRRLGVNVWPLNTVQYSNHTQYGKWAGHVFPPDHITDIVGGLADVQALPECDAVLSGYLGSEAQGEAVLKAVQQVKEANPSAIYCCDPVMGHPEKGCIVAPGLAEFFARSAVCAADIVCPNTLELALLTGGTQPAQSLAAVRAAAEQLLKRGPKAVFVKHLGLAGLEGGKNFEMLLVTCEGTWRVSAPLLHFDRPPVGVGDLTTGLLLAKRLTGATWKEALEHTAGAYHAVMSATQALGAYELQTVAAQDGIAAPREIFRAQQLVSKEA